MAAWFSCFIDRFHGTLYVISQLHIMMNISSAVKYKSKEI